MTLRVLLIATSLGLTGCAGGNDPAGSATNIGSGGTMGDSLDTTAPSTGSSSTTTSPTSAESSSTDAESSSSTSGGVTSDAESSSTGACVLSTEGCGCDPASDPECGDGLICNADNLCEVALCGDKADEPNDDPFKPFALMDLEDDDDPVLYESQLSGEGDVDWYRYGCNDPLLGLSNPNVDFAVPAGVRACLFLDCVAEGNPIFDCPEGTEAETAPIGFLPGCCVTGSAAFEIASYMCPDSANDAVETFLRIDNGRLECSEYSVTYGC